MTDYDEDYEDEEEEDIEQDHLDGLHFDDPHPLCWQCEEDERPESPDP